MKKLLIVMLLITSFSIGIKAQDFVDALRYSRLNNSGTARFVAMGGAFGALGADFSSLSYNPAGIGLYKSSEISITPSLAIGKTEATFNGTFRDDSKYTFNLGSVGIVMSTDISSRNTESKWRNVQFGFGINRMANFNSHVMIEGNNDESSLLSVYQDLARGIAPINLYSFDTGLAYDTDLLYFGSVADSMNSIYQIYYPNGGVNQRKSIDSKGSLNEMIFSFGANYGDKLYLGATLGVPYVRYNEISIYTETDESAPQPDSFYNYSKFIKTDNLETSGTGINFKFGLIYRVFDWMRLGGAIHTPTFYNGMSDSWNSSIESHFDDGSVATASSLEGFREYELMTPMRAIGSIGFVIGKFGVISADYEFVDYSSASLRASDIDFSNENEVINTAYLKANNLRLGTEWRFGTLNLRGGYNISDNPYKFGSDATNSSYSLGLGIREKSFFIDFAWVHSNMDDEYYLYSTDYVPAVMTKVMNNSFLMTVGIKY